MLRDASLIAVGVLLGYMIRWALDRFNDWLYADQIALPGPARRPERQSVSQEDALDGTGVLRISLVQHRKEPTGAEQHG